MVAGVVGTSPHKAILPPKVFTIAGRRELVSNEQAFSFVSKHMVNTVRQILEVLCLELDILSTDSCLMHTQSDIPFGPSFRLFNSLYQSLSLNS